MTDLEFTKIYVEGTPEMINEILELARKNLGDGINVIDLKPEILGSSDEK